MSLYSKVKNNYMKVQKRLNRILAMLAIVLVSWSAWVFYDNSRINESIKKPVDNVWTFRSIDTMKYSRDLAREKLTDQAFLSEINTQVSNIAATGANYVGIATPYDEEFVPYLTAWVEAARKNNLKVWFRGNWSSWEGWFGYPHQMTFDEHIAKSAQFIDEHKELFQDGDKFSACPECENGIQGDPRQTGRVVEYREFLIKETKVLNDKFKSTGLDVETNLLSMNMDVARLVMDKDTARAVGGVITVDHYVASPEDLADDAKELARETESVIVYGEFGTPIPDITGDMTNEEQAVWLERALAKVSNTSEVVGMSYWVNKDGSTELWESDNTAKPAVDVITKYFKLKR